MQGYYTSVPSCEHQYNTLSSGLQNPLNPVQVGITLGNHVSSTHSIRAEAPPPTPAATPRAAIILAGVHIQF